MTYPLVKGMITKWSLVDGKVVGVIRNSCHPFVHDGAQVGLRPTQMLTVVNENIIVVETEKGRFILDGDPEASWLSAKDREGEELCDFCPIRRFCESREETEPHLYSLQFAHCHEEGYMDYRSTDLWVDILAGAKIPDSVLLQEKN